MATKFSADLAGKLPDTRSAGRHRHFFELLLVIVVALLCSSNSSGNGFTYDDIAIIRDNPLWSKNNTASIDLGQIFSTNYWGPRADRDSLYRPLTILSFAFERLFFGESARSVHNLNITLYVLNCALCWWLLLLSSRWRYFALASAVIFSAMPLHSEVVAGGVGRSELLAASGVLLGLILHWQGKLLVLAPACYLLAAFSKESALLLPLLALALDLIVGKNGKSRKQLSLLYGGYGLALVVYLIARTSAVGLAQPLMHELLLSSNMLERTILSAQTSLTYIGQIFSPRGFSADYHNYSALPRPGLAQGSSILALSFWALVVLALTQACYRKIPSAILWPFFGTLWFVLCLAPTTNPFLPIGTLRADRLAYLPSLGVAIICGWLFAVNGKRFFALSLGSLILLALCNTQLFRQRNAAWYSQSTLWRSAVATNPYSPSIWRNIGDIESQQKNWPQAIAAYSEAARLRDSLGFFYFEAHLLSAQAKLKAGNNNAAELEYRQILERDSSSFTAALSLGQLLLDSSDGLPEALALFEHAIKLSPQSPHGYAHAAEALRKMGQAEQAQIQVDKALAMAPTIGYILTIHQKIQRDKRE